MKSIYLDQKIDEYLEELFLDLGLSTLTEEEKADMYARIQQRLHQVILQTLSPVAGSDQGEKLRLALEAEDYEALNTILESYPQFEDELQNRIDQEFANFRLIIQEEQRNAGINA